MLNQSEKAKFILALHKHSLAAFDTGGGVVGGGGAGGFLPNLSGSLTAQNTYQAGNPYDPSTLSSAVGNTNQVYGQEQGLGTQLAAEAAGTGPNPAAQLTENAMQQNTASANAVAQSQRGVNPGLAARDASMASTNANQVAAGQGAALAQQQQVTATGEEAGLLGQEGQQQQTQQSLYNNANEYAQGINSSVSQNNANSVNKTGGGILGGVSAGISSLFAKGGFVSRYADGGGVQLPNVALPNLSNASALAAPATPLFTMPKKSGAGGGTAGGVASDDSVNAYTSGQQDTDNAADFGPQLPAAGAGPMAGGSSLLEAAALSKGGPVSHIGNMLKSGKFSPKLAARGGDVKATTPSQKATVPGNSFKNDKIPTLLSQGEEVLPRNVMQSKDPVKAAADFVRAEMAKRGLSALHGLKRGGKSA